MRITINDTTYTIEDFFSFSKEAIFNMNGEAVSEYKFNGHNLTKIEIKDCLFDNHILMNVIVVFEGDEMSIINFYRSKVYFESHTIDNSYKEINKYLKTNLKWKREITLRYKNNLWINDMFKLEHSLIDRFGKEEILSIHKQKAITDKDLHEDKVEIVCRQNLTSKILIPIIIVLSLCILLILVLVFIEQSDIDSQFYFQLILIALLDIYLIVKLIVKSPRKDKYIFYKDKIRFYHKKFMNYEILTSNVEAMKYYPFKWKYLFTIIHHSFHGRGPWKLYITKSNKMTYTLSLVKFKEIKQLKILYPTLEIVSYTKQKKEK